MRDGRTIAEPAVGKDLDLQELCIEELYDTYGHSLYRFAYAITRSAEDAEDVLQEVFGKIARDRKRLVCSAAAKSYLYAAVRNSSYSNLRSRRRRGELVKAWADHFDPTCPDSAISVIRSQVVRDAFCLLPTEQREVIVLRVYDEMSFKEIADAIGCRLNTVASRYRYAIARLRKALEADDDE